VRFARTASSDVDAAVFVWAAARRVVDLAAVVRFAAGFAADLVDVRFAAGLLVAAAGLRARLDDDRDDDERDDFGCGMCGPP
jgi:hypothetical protein